MNRPLTSWHSSTPCATSFRHAGQRLLARQANADPYQLGIDRVAHALIATTWQTRHDRRPSRHGTRGSSLCGRA